MQIKRFAWQPGKEIILFVALLGFVATLSIAADFQKTPPAQDPSPSPCAQPVECCREVKPPVPGDSPWKSITKGILHLSV